MLEGLAAAFSTYSAIPVPYRSSGGPGTGAALFAFPAVGLVIGAAEIIAFHLLRIFRPGAFLQGCVLAALPVLITGGIHMDGFMDTCDAIHSWKGREERLAIMKDPHTGAYAVMGCRLHAVPCAERPGCGPASESEERGDAESGDGWNAGKCRPYTAH